MVTHITATTIKIVCVTRPANASRRGHGAGNGGITKLDEKAKQKEHTILMICFGGLRALQRSGHRAFSRFVRSGIMHEGDYFLLRSFGLAGGLEVAEGM